MFEWTGKNQKVIDNWVSLDGNSEWIGCDIMITIMLLESPRAEFK